MPMDETDKKSLVACLSEEVKNIRLAFQKLGYFAYKINFTPSGNIAPIIQVEARAWHTGDEELINNL